MLKHMSIAKTEYNILNAACNCSRRKVFKGVEIGDGCCAMIENTSLIAARGTTRYPIFPFNDSKQ